MRWGAPTGPRRGRVLRRLSHALVVFAAAALAYTIAYATVVFWRSERPRSRVRRARSRESWGRSRPHGCALRGRSQRGRRRRRLHGPVLLGRARRRRRDVRAGDDRVVWLRVAGSDARLRLRVAGGDGVPDDPPGEAGAIDDRPLPVIACPPSVFARITESMETDASGNAPIDPRRGRGLRRLSNALIVLGVVVIAYAGVILWWGDPATAVYAKVQQKRLSGALVHEMRRYEAAPPKPGVDAAVVLRRRARAFAQDVGDGAPFARLRVERMGLSAVVVHGTDWADDLSRGPGHYTNTSVPGRGRTVAIAGHRTTFGRPFREIDDLRRGDTIVLEMPYATFTYRVQGHRIVDDEDWSIIRNQGYDRLVLSACHPLYSAAQRWVVFARAVGAKIRGGATVEL
jgi:sortase A